jgi:hypothetical protein
MVEQVWTPTSHQKRAGSLAGKMSGSKIWRKHVATKLIFNARCDLSVQFAEIGHAARELI